MSTEIRDRILALLAIGICDSIADGSISIRDAEHLLFSPHSMKKLSQSMPELQELIHLGTELSDVLELIPSKLEQSLAEIRKLASSVLQNSSPIDFQQPKWIDEVF